MSEPVLPRFRDTPPLESVRAPRTDARDVLAKAALRNQRQVAAVLIGLAAVFVAGWLGLLAAGAQPVTWVRVVMVLTFTIAVVMVLDAARRLLVVRSVRVLLAAGERWQHADAHWIGRRGLRGRQLMVLSEDGAACLWVRDPSPATERAVDAGGRVLMLRPSVAGRSAVLVEQRAEILPARLSSSS